MSVTNVFNAVNAVRTGDLEAVKRLAKDDPESLETQVEGKPLIHVAVQRRLKEIVLELAQSYPDLNVRDKRGWTPLHLAVRERSMPTIKILLDNGADINAVDNDGKTVMHVAVQSRRIKSVHSENLIGLLLDNRADINAVDNDGKTALDIAQEKNMRGVTKALLEKGAKIGEGGIAVSIFDAVKADSRRMLEISLKTGNVNEKNKIGRTPLHSAASQGHEGIAIMLLKHDADPSIVDRYKMTALHLAAREGHTAIVNALIRKGADPNCEDEHGRKPVDLVKNNKEIKDILQRAMYSA